MGSHRKFYKQGGDVCDLSHDCEGKGGRSMTRCETRRDFSDHCCGTKGATGDLLGWTLEDISTNWASPALVLRSCRGGKWKLLWGLRAKG